MSRLFNIYCDESCHLENDPVNNTSMVIGGLWCPEEKRKAFCDRIREIKTEHGISPTSEIKWHKVSPAKLQYYLDLVNYFFDNSDLHFRALVVPDKRALRHADFNQTHDEFYYKMYFDMLKTIFEPDCSYNIYIDIKDTQGQRKVEKLHDVLCNSKYDFKREVIRRIQQIRSHEVELLGMPDLPIGSMSYRQR